jgi:Lipase (class 3)
MTIRRILVTALSLASLSVTAVRAQDDFEFTQEFLQLTRHAVHLSNYAYSSDPVAEATEYGMFESIQAFSDEPDAAVVASINGEYCMVAFRGTKITSWVDVYQNVRLGNEVVCSGPDGSGACCNVERGFYEGYNTNYKTSMEDALRSCASTCTSPLDAAGRTEDYDDDSANALICPKVVLTGHSQGGSIAATAALYLSDLNPIVITFGQPPAIDAPCDLLDEEQFFRFENSRVGRRGTTYDPVPYLPYNANQFGRQIMLGEDATGVAYMGTMNTEVEFRPFDAANGFASHRLTPDNVGYIHRIESLVRMNAWTSIRTTGFVDGTPCSQNIECDSKQCINERCSR